MSLQRNRREFLKTAAFTGIGMYVVDSAWAQDNKSPNSRINFACIGVGGKGGSDSADADKNGNIVAICDVDSRTLDRAAAHYPNAKKFTDYRKMLDTMGKSIDAVTVSIPDHNHAAAAAMAMHMGKGCFCQKPLTHSLYEARALGDLAKKMKVATQMGNQGTADSSRRKNAALVRAGALGKVSEVHVWTNRPIWPQGIPRPSEQPVPAYLDWDIWLGPAPARPYGEGYHTFAWRGWWDFGTGALGDMACHTVNLPFDALNLRAPISVSAVSGKNNKDSYPKWSIIRYEFEANKERGPVTMYWYDGGMMPPKDLMTGLNPPDSGSLIIGDKGKLYTPGDYGGGGKIIDGVDVGEVKYPISPGHFEEFARAIKGGEPAMSNFPNYAVPLTETILLGNLAVWADGKKIEWDSANLKAKNAPEVASVIKPTYRKGYSL